MVPSPPFESFGEWNHDVERILKVSAALGIGSQARIHLEEA
jgi:hypothetical protein